MNGITLDAFQSTLPHGERQTALNGASTLISHFNPRSRMGSDYTRLPISLKKYISIHAPAWGATIDRSKIVSIKTDFNPRSRMGSDVRRFNSDGCYLYFNPRSRMGSDTTAGAVSLCDVNFNPRSRMGSDYYAMENKRRLSNFNPRSRMGSDRCFKRMFCFRLYFNPRSRMGSDLDGGFSRSVAIAFQSTLPHGERRETCFQMPFFIYYFLSLIHI